MFLPTAQHFADSFSCRIGKGTHKALNRFRGFGYKVSQNNTKTCWVLKCDIRKFFENIDHEALIAALTRHSADKRIIWLFRKIIESFHSKRTGVGLPLGNLTSQLFVNIYMNKFDQFVKHKLKEKYYLRYADDFVIFSQNKEWLASLIPKIKKFLKDELKLELHKDKVSVKTLVSGIDFLGWIHFFNHRVLRTTTKRRITKNIRQNPKQEIIASYLGLIKHGNTRKFRAEIFKK